MKNMKLESFGTDAVGIRIQGDPQRPEPSHVRIAFPGGHVEVTRAQDGNPLTPYWVHVFVNKSESNNFDPTEPTARIVGARLDQTDKHASDSNLGDFERPELYHVALRVERTAAAQTDKVE